MSLPPTITTKHGEYEQSPHSNTIYCHDKWCVDVADPSRNLAWVFHSRMNPDEIVEFLQAYKEATNE